MNSWNKVWANKVEDSSQSSILTRLIKADGFDTGFGSIDENSWREYSGYVKHKLNMKDYESIYDVGCGAGAFLYNFIDVTNKIGGIDYSNNLIEIARKYMHCGEFRCAQATDLDLLPYDHVVSNSVFFYFPSLEYSYDVLSKMCLKANKTVAILEVNDIDVKEQFLDIRKSHLTEEEYQRRYNGLDHLFFSKSWFYEFAKEHSYKIDIEQQNINGYLNNKFRFNVYLTMI
ncbi:class I SAM-dependent methyltransferase [bacterium]|nr:class I SAM-dependent methyltransferase [bacterium]